MFDGGFPGGSGGWGAGPGLGGAGFGGLGFGSGGAGFGGPGFGGPGCGGGPGGGGSGFGPGSGGGHKRAVFGTAALLLDGPADPAQIVARVSEATDGAFTPPQEVVELAFGLLAVRGVVSVKDGVATLTEFGKSLLAWRGISSETTHAFLARFAKFVDVIKIHKEFREVAGLGRTIGWSGTDEQKEKLAEVKTQVLAALTEAKRSLHSVLGES